MVASWSRYPESRRESRVDDTVAADALAHLCGCEFLELTPGERPMYRFGPRADLQLITAVRDVYDRDRISVINAFYTCNLESLRSFASAFRIRRPT